MKKEVTPQEKRTLYVQPTILTTNYAYNIQQILYNQFCTSNYATVLNVKVCIFP